MDRRVNFFKGEQRKFIFHVLKNINSPSLSELSNRIQVPYSTLKNYYAEKNCLPEFLFKDLCAISNINSNMLKVTYLNDNWGKIKGGRKGIKSMMKIYQQQLPLWRFKGNKKFAGINIKEIKSPKMNEDLAEFIGVYLGDGTITNYFMRISGDYRYDLPYFNYLSNLVFKLFGINSKIVRDKRLGINTCYLIIYSKKVCEFLKNNYGIKPGNKIKNNTCIPKGILINKKLSIACLRGLVDTDGSISRRGRGGSQFCINFTSHNSILFEQVNEIGKRLKIFTYKTKNDIGTNRWKNIISYFNIVGSSNLRHIVRFYLRYKDYKTIYQNEVPLYYEKPFYKNITLPFKMVPWSSG